MNKMRDKNYWIKALKMEKHPEGGYSSQTYRSPQKITDEHIHSTFEGTRPLSTSIYFLIHDDNVSNFHRLKSDEIWYYHVGQPLTIAVIDKNGVLFEYKLGLNIQEGERPQVLVSAGSIFGSYIKENKGYSLVGCMVSFGFDFKDFELFKRADLLKKYPSYEDMIVKLTPSP